MHGNWRQNSQNGPQTFHKGSSSPSNFQKGQYGPSTLFFGPNVSLCWCGTAGCHEMNVKCPFCLLVLLIFACAFLTFFLFLTFWSLMYLYVLCFYRMCSTFNIMFSIKFYNIKHRAFCMCSTSIVFVKQWEAIIWLSCAGLCVFSWSRGTCKKNQAGACPTEGTWGRLHRLDP